MQRENRLHKIKRFAPFLSESLDHQDSVWADIDLAATKIASGEGYGPPIAALIEAQPAFQVKRYGMQLCDTSVLYQRYYKIKKSNKVLFNVTFGERIAMLLSNWKMFNQEKNPRGLPFSRWILEEQALYRGMPIEQALDVARRGVMDDAKFYSFSFLTRVARMFTIPGYAEGRFVTRRSACGYVFEARVRPIDFHIFMGVGLDDEMEAVIRGPVVVTVHGSVGCPLTSEGTLVLKN